jgi:hypothetical protein
MEKPLPPELRALDRAQYEFDFDTAPLREHRFYAYAPSDDALSEASGRRLTHVYFEKVFRFQYFDVELGEWRLKHLKGYDGDYYWKGGTLKFLLRSPTMPVFGLLASNVCPDIPVMYVSCPLGGRQTAPRYFYNGRECISGIDARLAAKFAALNDKRWGIITDRPSSTESEWQK